MIMVDEVKEYTIGMKQLLRRSQYATHLTYLARFGVPPERIYCLLDNDIKSLLRSEDCTSLIAARDSRLSGILVGSLLKWDTAHFGFPCYKINYLFSNEESNTKHDESVKKALLASFKKKVKQRQGRLTIGRIVGGDWGSLWALESEGFKIVDTLIVFAKDITKVSAAERALPFATRVTMGCQPDLLPRLKNIMVGAFPASRFIVDPHFPTGSGEQIYLNWLEGICHESGKDGQEYVAVHSEEGHKGGQEKLFTVEKDQDVVGFISYKKQKRLGLGSIELVASNPKYRGQKVSDYMIGLVENELRSDGINILEVTAYLYNYPALNAYMRSSFSAVSSLYTFHLWM